MWTEKLFAQILQNTEALLKFKVKFPSPFLDNDIIFTATEGHN